MLHQSPSPQPLTRPLTLPLSARTPCSLMAAAGSTEGPSRAGSAAPGTASRGPAASCRPRCPASAPPAAAAGRSPLPKLVMNSASPGRPLLRRPAGERERERPRAASYSGLFRRSYLCMWHEWVRTKAVQGGDGLELLSSPPGCRVMSPQLRCRMMLM